MKALIPQIHSITGGTKTTRALYEEGLLQAIAALNSPEFKHAIYNFRWADPESGHIRTTFKNDQYSYIDKETRALESKTVTRKKLYSLIMSGWDKFDQTEDGDLDLKATLFYNRWSSAVGYTYPNTFATWINTKFWTGSQEDIVARIAANIVHEYMHNLGFDHAYKWNPSREFTVPYAVGTIVYEIVKGIYSPERDTFEKVCWRSWKRLWLVKTCRWQKVSK